MIDTRKFRTFCIRARNGVGYLLRGDVEGLKGRMRALRRERRMGGNVAPLPGTILPGTLLQWCVMATPHTLFIAHLFARRLREHGWGVSVVTQEPESFDAHFYIVICPQMFRRLPPPERRFLYQMEQSVSTRWFTKEYMHMLLHSRAVLDYALVNFEYLEKNDVIFPHTHYLPVGADPDYGKALGPQAKVYDVLFYGDAASSPRRRKLLAALEERFSVHRCSEVFGDEMRREIMRSRVVINLHYYENALLEMPRVQECLSLGVPVVSEGTQDQNDYPELEGAVHFFPEGDQEAMLETVAHALAEPVEPDAVRAAAARGWERFCFMFDRFLVATQMLNPARLLNDTLPIPGDATRLVLSLPETIRRRRSYDKHRVAGSFTFDGVRYSPGWIGCGLSYGAMARHALRHQHELMLIVEDDAELPPDFEDKIARIRAYLQARPGEWDVFAGLIADLQPDAEVLKVETFDGMQFVTIDKMTSTVCNFYSKRGLELLAAWNPAEGDAHTNTIDRYLGEHCEGLRVVVVLPFLAGLTEELDSTLWGIGNRRYIDMIADSQVRLEQKVDAFLQRQAGAAPDAAPALVSG